MEYQSKLAENIHSLILDIDSCLSTCAESGIRERLVKAVYELRDLENLLISDKFDRSINNTIQKVLTSI